MNSEPTVTITVSDASAVCNLIKRSTYHIKLSIDLLANEKKLSQQTRDHLYKCLTEIEVPTQYLLSKMNNETN